MLSALIMRVIARNVRKDVDGPEGSRPSFWRNDEPRTAEEREKDRRSGLTWLVLLLMVPLILVMLYFVT